MRHCDMTEEVFWTIVFGTVASAIGLVTIWQNSQIIQTRRVMSEFTIRG